MKRGLIIFDMDGVLFDSTKLVRDFFLSKYPTMTGEIMDEILVGNFHDELEKFKSTNKHIEETPEERTARSEKYSKDKSSTSLYSGIKELLHKLHTDGYILTINTSAFERNCIPLLKSSGIESFFDFVATAEISKNKIEKFMLIKEKYSASQNETIFITDTLGDIREADVAQIPTIAVTWGAHDRTYFTREVHDNLIGICDSVDDLERQILNF